jgi:hypothetical protein
MATHPSVDELEKREEEAFKTGPLSVLTTSVKSNSQVCNKQGSVSSTVSFAVCIPRACNSRAVGADQLSEQQKAARACESLRQALQYDLRERKRDVD